MVRNSFRRAALAVFVLVTMLCQGTWALAGTTGGLTGVVLDAQSNAPVAGAKVTVTSPSQSVSSTTDAAGHFAFLSLSPDTYTVAAERSGYEPVSLPGESVFADSTQNVSIRMTTQLKTIATVTSTATGSLVKSGTTADVYAISAATQAKVTGVGGGGGLNSAYSAIATVPGAYVAGNQTGYFQTVHIRGGDFDQVGYEFDGVPINRSFDNYPSGAASSLGQQEVQVYTGASPANSESQGLAGFINQVIKSGTTPGFGDTQLGIGTPVFYHHALVEAGGATPNRLFSYYVGLGGYNQSYEYANGSNAANYNNYLGVPIAAEAGGVWQLAGTEYGLPAGISIRDSIINLHFGIPHHNDGGRDDVQLLYDGESINNAFYQSPFQAVGNDPGTAYGNPFYTDGYAWNCGTGQTLTSATEIAATPGCIGAYNYPNTAPHLANVPGTPTSCPASTAAVGPYNPCTFLGPQTRDTSWNDQQIFKLQYQKNFGSTAYLRAYGYTYYSDWLLDGPNSTYDNIVGTGFGATAPDYELTAHTRGVSLSFSDQINAKNLVSLQGAYTTATAIRDNNLQPLNALGVASLGGVGQLIEVNAGDPYSGRCYGAPAAPGGPSALVTCNPGVGAATSATIGQVATGVLPTLGTSCPDANSSSTACAFLVAENGKSGAYNAVTPQFTSYSLTDEFRPNDRVLINAGLRIDQYRFIGGNTDAGPARQFWYNAYNLDTCVNANGQPADVSTIPGAAVGSCPSGYTATQLQNDSGTPTESFSIFQPRLAATYTFNPDTVLRASVGKYGQPPNTAFEQYNTHQLNEPFTFLGPDFYAFGRYSPSASVRPPTSTNADVSLEKHFKGTDLSFKLTPFLRHTQDQIQNFYLNQNTGFISGLNVGSQSSRGVEFQLQKGDFSRNGLSGLLSFAYTYSTIKYGALSNGTTIITPLNATIANYNAYTKACAPGGADVGRTQFGQPLCGTTNSSSIAAPCYYNSTPGASGATVLPDPTCSQAGSWGNPYWNDNAHNLIDPNQQFPTYDIFPAGIGSSASSFGAPYVGTIVVNYKHDKFSLTPSLQLQGGQRYGAPETEPGIQPDTNCGVLGPGTNSNYPYGNPGANAYDATGCGSGLVIPNPFTQQFDNLGSFVQPTQMMFNMQVSYQASNRVTLTGTFANIVNTCFGGTKAAWTVGDHNICSYGAVANGLIPPKGNIFNPGSAASMQSFRQYPYQGALGPFDISGLNGTTKQPFQFFVEANIKL
ncbi:MAG: TonB-dependent receptor [Candidatus Eremiobacteraeota bacterium]|nr:TonB-dependent receptor [Candidatus Eremiobacteraeota bacterium]